jgi:hypothetical protein
MKDIEGTVTCGGTINLGNFENVKIEFSQSYTALTEVQASHKRAVIITELEAQFFLEKDYLLSIKK